MATMPQAARRPKGELIDQRGRAELEFVRHLRTSLTPLRERVGERLAADGVLDEPWTGIEELREKADAVVGDMASYRFHGAGLRWARNVATPRAAAAFERRRDLLEPLARPAAEVPDETGGSVPRYWEYDFHVTTGGWDGHEHMGFIHHELVYHYLLAKVYGAGGDLYAQREAFAAAAPADSYRAIVDLGCGTGQYTLKLAQVYPDAAITGLDLSATALRYAARRAEEAEVPIGLRRAPAENTGLPSGAYDLVTSYILLHEMPPHAIRAVFAEAFRLLRPGGHVHFADVGPYRRRPAYNAWSDDWDAEHGNEPWWRTAATADLAEIAAQAGFTGIEQRPLGPGGHPMGTTARRPEGV